MIGSYRGWCLICLLALGLVFASGCSRGRDKNGGPERKTIEITDEVLYKEDIWEIDREYGFEGVSRVLGILQKRAVMGERRSLERLFEIRRVADGYLAEGVSSVLSEVFNNDPAFVLENALALEPGQREMLFKAIISELYYDHIFSGKYPPEFEEIRALGVPSARFVKMYEYYLKNPAHLEDWSITPPA